MQISLKIGALLVISGLALSACGGLNSGGSINSAGSGSAGSGSAGSGSAGGSLGGSSSDANTPRRVEEGERRETIFDLLNPPDEGAILGVNKYIWRATTEVLSFLPLEAADPFTGTLVYGYGTAPGSSRAYRVTVLISDPALDARALKVAVRTRGGASSAELQRQIENAILTRARQLRISRANI
ncbi:MAG: DUF3576 domain-containing protein [Pseudomonadota bacterium]